MDVEGRWNEMEQTNELTHAAINEINYHELWTAFMVLKAYSQTDQNAHIKHLIDNTTAIACIKQMGRTKSIDCNNLGNFVFW